MVLAEGGWGGKQTSKCESEFRVEAIQTKKTGHTKRQKEKKQGLSADAHLFPMLLVFAVKF